MLMFGLTKDFQYSICMVYLSQPHIQKGALSIGGGEGGSQHIIQQANQLCLALRRIVGRLSGSPA